MLRRRWNWGRWARRRVVSPAVLTPFDARSRTIGEPASFSWIRSSGSAWSRIDLDGGGHTSSKNHARRHLIEMDADRNALGQADPGEDRVDCCKSFLVGLRVRDVDAARDAVDVPPNDLAVAHQLDAGRVTRADSVEIGFLEVAVDPERVRIDEGDLVLPNTHVVTELGQKVGDITIDRRADLRAR